MTCDQCDAPIEPGEQARVIHAPQGSRALCLVCQEVITREQNRTGGGRPVPLPRQVEEVPP